MPQQRRDVRLTLDQSRRLSKARTLGQARALPIYLEDWELTKLISVILSDLGNSDLADQMPKIPDSDYYKIAISWFSQPENVAEFVPLYLECVRRLPDFETYFENLCELHKRRRQFEMILSAQPLPTMLQVSPRALLEFGIIPTPALASWLTWRKWFYDIDNRVAQETGYLFEPILANALGGVPYGARNSPIKRWDNRSKGRQVDCIVDRDAYEFKLRVTIAASGQGRFAEELDFARDCNSSGYTPILLVLDPTPSARLDDLRAAFEQYKGRAYIGDDAWQHIESEAGTTMATFVDKYVRRPIAALDHYATDLLDLYIGADSNRSSFHVQIGRGSAAYKWSIKRSENLILSVDEGNEE